MKDGTNKKVTKRKKDLETKDTFCLCIEHSIL